MKFVVSLLLCFCGCQVLVAQVLEHCQTEPLQQTLEKEIPLTYRPNYFLPLTFDTRNPDTIRDEDIRTHEDPEVRERQNLAMKFQISLQVPFFARLTCPYQFFLVAAFTQKSFWQLYDTEGSRPFRETNYNPEIFFFFPTVYRESGFRIQLKVSPWSHESNGRERGVLDRSWDRIYVEPTLLYRTRMQGALKVWYRLPERQPKNEEDEIAVDVNPDIEDFYGNSELRLRYYWNGKGTTNEVMTGMMARRNFSTGNGAIQLDFTYRIEEVHLYYQYWNGFGESLIDHRVHIVKHGIGLMFYD